MIGKKVANRYEILALIGGGGMSLVYQAKDMFLNRIVALKILREQFTSDIEFIRRFRREAQAVASLSHPNIVSIYDVGQDENIYYLVMEYIKGKTLKEIINEKAPLPLNEAVEIAKQICDALEHAHENAIVHRDIKPHNILITGEGRVKVTDFGIARAVSTATVTHTRGIIGSVHYFSPEQAKGEVTGEKSDIYSLGIVLYEMLTGKLPFEGDSPISVALKHIQAEPIPPSQYNPEIPEKLESIILKAISKKPEDRYENVSKLRLDLMSALFDKFVKIPEESQKQSYSSDDFTSNTVNEDTLVFKESYLDNMEDNYEEKNKKKKLKHWALVLIPFLVIFLLGGILWGAGKFFIKEEVLVPNVVNHSLDDAQKILSNEGLKISVVKKVPHSEISEGKIISQDPLPDTKTKTGRTVELVVSSGPLLVPVPEVIGSSQVLADVNLSNAGLDIGEVSEVYSSDFAQGIVVDQFPKAGEMVPEKSKVDLIVSKGPEPQYISMPLLVGMDLSQAEAKLQEFGLYLGEIKKQESELYPENFVIEQNPVAGKEIFQGSYVNLVISKGPGPSTQQATVRFKLNESGEVRIDVQDVKGTRTVYKKYHQAGDIFATNVGYYGQGIISVYINGIKVKQESVPSNQ